MTTDLPFRATTQQAVTWLAARTGTDWTLPQLLAQALTPYVWLDYDAAYPDLFGDANGGYAAPIFFEDDIARLAAGSDDVLITITKDAYKIVTRLPAPGFRRALDELRFLKKDLEKLAARLEQEALAPARPAATAQETQAGIGRDEVLLAFAACFKGALGPALDAGGGIFGDDGARVKGSARKGKNKALYNPVTLALGLNEVHHVPIGQLKRVFQSQPLLQPWLANWQHSLALLGK
jgi:hypothetical protein